jgi:hypothetical protein
MKTGWKRSLESRRKAMKTGWKRRLETQAGKPAKGHENRLETQAGKPAPLFPRGYVQAILEKPPGAA